MVGQAGRTDLPRQLPLAAATSSRPCRPQAPHKRRTLRTECCQMFLSLSRERGLSRKSTAPRRTARSTSAVPAPSAISTTGVSSKASTKERPDASSAATTRACKMRQREGVGRGQRVVKVEQGREKSAVLGRESRYCGQGARVRGGCRKGGPSRAQAAPRTSLKLCKRSNTPLQELHRRLPLPCAETTAPRSHWPSRLLHGDGTIGGVSRARGSLRAPEQGGAAGPTLRPPSPL